MADALVAKLGDEKVRIVQQMHRGVVHVRAGRAHAAVNRQPRL